MEQINFANIKGVILNVPSGFLSLPVDLNFKHWIVIRQIDGTFYNLDSKLAKPEAIGYGEDVMLYLTEKILHKKTQMLLIVEPEVEQSGAWYNAANRTEGGVSDMEPVSNENSATNEEMPKTDGDHT